MGKFAPKLNLRVISKEVPTNNVMTRDTFFFGGHDKIKFTPYPTRIHGIINTCMVIKSQPMSVRYRHFVYIIQVILMKISHTLIPTG